MSDEPDGGNRKGKLCYAVNIDRCYRPATENMERNECVDEQCPLK